MDTEIPTENEEIKASGEMNAGISLYELNKQLISNLTPYTEEQIEEKKDLIRKFARTANINTKFFMLLGREISYYTIFNRDSAYETYPRMADEVIACLQDIGQIVDIHKETGAIECWVKDADNNPYIFMLFPYDAGVIKCQ